MEMLVGGKGPRSFEKPIFGSVRCEELAERPNMTCVEALHFECFASDGDPVLILGGLQHFYPEFVDVKVVSKIMTVRVDIGEDSPGRTLLGVGLAGGPLVIGGKIACSCQGGRRQGAENSVLTQRGAVGIAVWSMRAR